MRYALWMAGILRDSVRLRRRRPGFVRALSAHLESLAAGAAVWPRISAQHRGGDEIFLRAYPWRRRRIAFRYQAGVSFARANGLRVMVGL